MMTCTTCTLHLYIYIRRVLACMMTWTMVVGLVLLCIHSTLRPAVTVAVTYVLYTAPIHRWSRELLHGSSRSGQLGVIACNQSITIHPRLRSTSTPKAISFPFFYTRPNDGGSFGFFWIPLLHRNRSCWSTRFFMENLATTRFIYGSELSS